MRRLSFATASIAIAALGLALNLGTVTPASATLVVEWNPSATGNTTAGTFSADSFGLRDWATIGVPTDPSTPGSVTESGFLEISGFTLSGNPVSTVHTTGLGGYGIYELFTATSHLGPCGTELCGAFDWLRRMSFYTRP